MSDSTTITAAVTPDAPGTDEDVDVLAAHDVRILGQSVTVTGIVFSILLALAFIVAIAFPLWLHVRNRRRRARKNLEKSVDLPPSAFPHFSLKIPRYQQPEWLESPAVSTRMPCRCHSCRRARASASGPGQPHPEGQGNRPLSPILESPDSHASLALPAAVSSGAPSLRFSDNNAAPAPCVPALCDSIPAERRLHEPPRTSFENPVRELSRHGQQGPEFVRTVDPPFSWVPEPFAHLYLLSPSRSPSPLQEEFSTPPSFYDSPQTPDSLSFHRLPLVFSSGSPDSYRAGLLSGHDDAIMHAIGLGLVYASAHPVPSLIEREGYWASDIA